MELFCRRMEFERGGLGARGTGLSTVALTGALFISGLSVFSPYVTLLVVFLFYLYIKGYWPFYRFVYKKRPKLLPIAILFNFYFCITITLGAMYGALRFFTSTGYIDGSHDT